MLVILVSTPDNDDLIMSLITRRTNLNKEANKNPLLLKTPG
jgi:hypothetical protein